MRSTSYQFARWSVGSGPTKVLSVCLFGGLAALTACASEPDNDPANAVASAASAESSGVQSAAVPSVDSANGGGTASASNVLGAPSQSTPALEASIPPALSSAPMGSDRPVPSSATAASTTVGASSSGTSVPQPMASSESDAGSVEPDPDPMGDPEPGRLKGITAQHNLYRAQVAMGEPLPDLVWDPAIAEIAQDWADTLAEDCSFMHSMYPGLGENLATFGASNAGGGTDSGPDAVDLWYSEIDCYSYGTIPGGRSEDPEECSAECDAYGGCGHYTQLVWRETLRVGCGVASCQKDGFYWNTYVCNYDPPGNYIGEYPY
jgi:pathogenesis-related protein 1